MKLVNGILLIKRFVLLLFIGGSFPEFLDTTYIQIKNLFTIFVFASYRCWSIRTVSLNPPDLRLMCYTGRKPNTDCNPAWDNQSRGNMEDLDMCDCACMSRTCATVFVALSETHAEIQNLRSTDTKYVN